MTATPKGWYSRHYLPHFDQPGLVQAITFRLADSLPRALVTSRERLGAALADNRAHMHALLDRSLGSCALWDPRCAQLVEDALLYHDSERYRLLAWVVMPNHVHVLIETLPPVSLHRIVATWKSYTARRINELLERSGPFWQSDYYDRYIRDEDHLARAVAYVHNNPVAAGLVARPVDWQWSSVRRLVGLDATFHEPYEDADAY